MSTVIETKLLITGQDGGAQKSVEAIAKALRDVGEAAKVSAPVDKLAKSLLQVEKAQKAVTAAMKAEAGLKDANARLKATSDAAKALAGEYDRARKAAEAFKGVKIEKGSDQARAAKDAASAVREAGRAYRGAEADVRRATAAVAAQMSAFQGANRAAVALGAPINRLADHQRKLTASINQTTQALLRQEAAEKRAAAAAQQTAARRAGRREAAGTIAAGAGVYAASKGKKLAGDAVQSAADFDLAVRKQKVFTDISAEDQKRLLAQAKQIGQETQFSNIDVVKAQTAAMQGLPASYSSSTKAQVAEGIVGHVRNYSTLMETDLKQGAETIRGFLQQTGKDISTGPKALYEANKATNQLVKMAKLGGMDGEDVAQFAKYAASSATAAGISTDTTLTLGALARRGGLRGDEAGTFIRAASGKLVSPDNPGMTALAAAGITHSKYVTMPDRLSTSGLEGEFQRKMGKGFTPAIRKKLDAINSDASLIGDRGKYSTAVTGAVESLLGRTKRGTVSALESGKAARIAGSFHKVSGKSVDTERLLQDIFNSKMTLPQLNAFLTGKHGGKGAITQGQWDEFKANRAEISKVGDDPNFAKNKADYVFAGVGGSFENLKGSLENFVLQVGLANEGLIKFTADGIGKGVDAFSNLSQTSQQVLSLVGGGAAVAGGVYGAVKVGGKLLGMGGGAGLTGSAVALTHSAALLDAAAIKLATGNLTDAVPDKVTKASKMPAFATFGLPGIGAALAAGALYGLSDESKGITHGGIPEVKNNLNPQSELPGLGYLDEKKAEAKGNEAGKATGDGVVKGIEEKAPEIEEKGKTLYEKLKNIFSEGIKIPIDFASAEGGGGSGGGMGGLIQKASFGGDAGAAPMGRGGSGGASFSGRGGGTSAGSGVRFGGSGTAVASLPTGAGGGGGGSDKWTGAPGFLREGARESYDFWRGKGLSSAAAAGLVGMEQGENNFKAHGYGDRGTSYGSFMWKRDRRREILAGTGKNMEGASHKEQLEGAYWEMTQGRHKGLFDKFKGDHTPESAAALGVRRFEIPADIPGASRRRGGFARSWMNRFEAEDSRAGTLQKTLPPKKPDESATELRAATENLKAISIASHHTVEVSAKPGSSARTTGMRSSASGPIKADTGVSMPQAQARDGDWI